MDENKLEILKRIGYKVNKTCGFCIHGTFWDSEWGTCKIHTYNHLKHTAKTRQLSITIFGSCSKHEIDPDNMLGRFDEFL